MSPGQRGPVCGAARATGHGWPGPEWSCAGVRPAQVADPNQVVDGGREGEQPAHSAHAPDVVSSAAGDGLQPAEDLFHEFALLLADRVAGVPRGSAIYGAAPVVVFCAMCGVTPPQKAVMKSPVSYPVSAPSVALGRSRRTRPVQRLARAFWNATPRTLRQLRRARHHRCSRECLPARSSWLNDRSPRATLAWRPIRRPAPW